MTTSLAFDIIARDRASSTFDKVGKSASSSTQTLKKFGTIAAVGFAAAGTAAVGAGKYFFGVSARLELMGNKAKTVFGGQIGMVDKWAKANAGAMGLTSREATGLAANFADLLIPMGFARKQAAGMSTDVVGLSGALSQWSGGTRSAAEVSEILAKAMLGERDGLKELGISISDADVQARLLKTGQDKLKGSALEQAKALITQKLIFEKSTDAQKAFAKGGSPLLSAQARIKARLGEVRDAIAVKLIPAFATAADWATKKLPVAFDTVKRALGKVRDKIDTAFDKLDITGVGTNLATQAKSWAEPVIDGFKTGLDSGDWSGLGQALGNGIVRALKGLGSMLGKLTDAFDSWFSKVDWVGIGITMGKQAPALVAGLAIGLLNFDVGSLLKGLADHWQLALLAVISVAFTPGRFIGWVGKVLAKIPFVGKLLEWALLHFKKFADGMVGMVGKALGFLGRAFMSGFRRVFPDVGKSFGEALRVLPTRLGVIAIEIQAKAARMIAGLARAIGSKIEAVVAKIGELTGKILEPWADAGRWLLGIGKSIVQGLINGIGSMAGSVVSAIKSSITDKIPGFIKDKLGIHSPSIVLTKIGVNLMEGLVKGIESRKQRLNAVLGALIGFVKATGEKLKGLLSDKASFVDSFKSSFAGSSVFGSDATDIASILAFQQQKASGASALKTNIAALIGKGVSKSVLEQLASGGDSGLAQIDALAHASASQIDAFNKLVAATNANIAAAANLTGSAMFDPAIAAAKRDQAAAQAIVKELKKLLDKQDKNTVVQLIIDGKVLKTSLLELKRKSGSNLGLA